MIIIIIIIIIILYFRGSIPKSFTFSCSLYIMSLGMPQKKSSPLNGRAIKRGEGQRAGSLRKKELFLKPFFPTFQNFNGH